MEKHLVQDGQQLVLEIIDKPQSALPLEKHQLRHGLLARVPLSYSDFQLARDETWWSGIRSGKLSEPLDHHELRVIPGEDGGAGLLDGYFVDLKLFAALFLRFLFGLGHVQVPSKGPRG